MVKHTFGLILGDLKKHCFFYDRLEELEFLKKNIKKFNIKKLSLIGVKDHYIRIYNRHRLQILTKFEMYDQSNFLNFNLEYKEKFNKKNK